MTVRMAIFVDEDTARALRVAAAHRGTGISEVVTMLVQDHLVAAGPARRIGSGPPQQPGRIGSGEGQKPGRLGAEGASRRREAGAERKTDSSGRRASGRVAGAPTRDAGKA